VEVIEHLEVGRLRALERVVFEFAKPALLLGPLGWRAWLAEGGRETDGRSGADSRGSVGYPPIKPAELDLPSSCLA
jgi:hypothetical protein